MKKMVGRRVLGFAMASVMAMGMGTAAMAEETTYPMDTDATFVYWGELNGSVSANFNSLADTEIGKDWQEILTFAKEKQVDLIVMGRQGHSALQKPLFGSVTEKITRKAECAVLVVPLSYQQRIEKKS